MARKPGLSFERHCEIGQQLAAIQEQITSLHVEVGNAYPQGEKLVNMLYRVGDELGKVRSRADDIVLSVFPEACVHVYYPGEPVPSGCDGAVHKLRDAQ